MAEVAIFESRENKIDADIKAEVSRIRGIEPMDLPSADTAIVRSYIRKIEGDYNVERAKTDTDNAIDLLYIAYNTTPQREGDVRATISELMSKMILAQKASQSVMGRAMSISGLIVKRLDDVVPDWIDIRKANERAEIKGFVTEDVIKVATEIKAHALTIRDQLLSIAATYDGIIKDLVTATSKSEKALSAQLKEKAAIEKEINEANAKREQLESLVNDLKEEVAKFDKMARDYESRANTAEQRAFVMSIVRVGAQMISQAIPAIAMAAAGPAPMLASSALGALSGPPPARPAGDAADAGKAAESAQTRTRISEQRAEIKRSDEKVAALRADIANLESEKAKLAPGDGDGADPARKDAAAGSAIQIAEYDKRIKVKADELKAQEGARAGLEEAVKSLQGSLDAVDKGMGKLSDEQQQQAANLRDMQMRMLDKAETYEKERRNQSAELVKINALLKGKRTEDETIQLAIKSLNLSLSALKRTKEIVEEVAYFFKSFADFMEGVAMEASAQVDGIELVSNDKPIRDARLKHLVASIDGFFITQTAEWRAVATVSEKFQRSFADGWSKLNKLSGDYITGDRLTAYLETASVRLSAIVAERDAATQQKLASFEAYRAQMRESA